MKAKLLSSASDITTDKGTVKIANNGFTYTASKLKARSFENMQ